MRIFSINGAKLTEVKEQYFPLENTIQRLTESNLHDLFDLQFVKSEFELHGFRIDTLAFDEESKAFVIIEYKKDKTFSVVDQGMAYLNLMLNNKSDFILEYNETHLSSRNLKREEIDWSQSRIIFISPKFTKYQQHAIGFKDLGIQLWEVHKYDKGLLVFDEVNYPSSKESLAIIAKNSSIAKKVTQQIRVYAEEDHVDKADENIKELYFDLKNSITSYHPQITIRPTKSHVGFKKKRVFAAIHLKAHHIMIHFKVRIDELQDPKKMAKIWIKKNESKITLSRTDELPYALTLIKQAFDKDEDSTHK